MISEFDVWLSNEIWAIVKGKSIPESYTDQDRLEIIQRYWSRAVNSGGERGKIVDISC
jgi:hypothetical protein